MTRASTILLLLLACASLAACGGSSSDDADSSSSIERKIAALEAEEAEEKGITSGFNIEAHWTKTFSYTSDEMTSLPGKIRVGFTNPQSRPHDVAIEDPAGKTIGQSEPVVQEADSFVAQLHPGTYHYYCTLPGHRDKGMEGTLRVSK